MERRNTPKAELRVKRDGGRSILTAYAAEFGVLSDDLGGFVEMIAPGAFLLDKSPDVICNFDHDDCRMLGRTTSGTLRLTQDDRGLAFECDLSDTELDRYILDRIERGDLRGCSFAFDLDPDDPEAEEWGETDDGRHLRTIKRVRLFDVAVVVHPAYSAADFEVALRSLKKRRRTPSARSRLNRARLEIAQSEIARA